MSSADVASHDRASHDRASHDRASQDLVSQDLAIGQVAALSQVSVSAVRFYADAGLLAVRTRVGGKRRFAPGAVERVDFIRRCQEAGFTLEEIRSVLNEGSSDWRRTVDAKLAELSERRQRLDETIAVLTEVRACGCAAIGECDLAVPSR